VIFRMKESFSNVSEFLSVPAADGPGNLGAEQNPLSIPVVDHGAWATAMNNLGIMTVGISGQQLVSGTLFFQCDVILLILLKIMTSSMAKYKYSFFILYNFSLLVTVK
ncbi:hypothetical protein XENOCAPTIV_018430, partial [Xenoophorus captivus]